MLWLKRICDETIPLSSFTTEALMSWETCAIGEAVEASLSVAVPFLDPTYIRPSGDVGPRDPVLYRKGVAFGRAVARGDRKAALRFYLAIQQRIADLALKGKKRGK